LRFEAVSRRSSLGQLLPPLLIFVLLLVRTGTALVLGGALVALAVAFSLGRLAWLAWRKPPAGTRLLRAVLTVVFGAGVLALSWLEVSPVHRYVDRLAAQVQQQCVANGRCPARIGGWRDAPGATGSDADMGKRVRYALAYRTDGRDFRLCWVAAFGRCRSVAGGVGTPLRPSAPLPWPQVGADGAPP
jgi:hypothetical protein